MQLSLSTLRVTRFPIEGCNDGGCRRPGARRRATPRGPHRYLSALERSPRRTRTPPGVGTDEVADGLLGRDDEVGLRVADEVLEHALGLRGSANAVIGQHGAEHMERSLLVPVDDERLARRPHAWAPGAMVLASLHLLLLGHEAPEVAR